MHAALSNDVARDFAEALSRRLGDELVRVSLFGSRARGEARLRSDFDLMVVLQHARGSLRDVVHRLATEIELAENVDLSTKIVDLQRFNRLRVSASTFWRSFARDERVLWPKMKSPSR